MGTVVSANRTAPAPLLRFREGEEVTVNVKNEMTDESLRLRVINAGAMTIFDVRIPGLKMTVVHADGQDVEPVEVDEFRMGAAETYDVIVQPKEDKAYTIFAEPMDRSDFAAATLAPRKGMRGPLPPRRKRPLRTMKDMGMVHAGAHGGMNHGATDHGAMKPLRTMGRRKRPVIRQQRLRPARILTPAIACPMSQSSMRRMQPKHPRVPVSRRISTRRILPPLRTPRKRRLRDTAPITTGPGTR